MKPTSSQSLELTAAEVALVLDYRATDDRGRNEIEGTADYQAREWPRQVKPTLRLIIGGAA